MALPIDPDAPDETRGVRPLHLRPSAVLIVFTGGVIGTSVRYGLGVLAPTHAGQWPLGTFLANVAGAFVLGVLLEGLARAGSDDGRRRRARLFVGTGCCGGLTTYSTSAARRHPAGRVIVALLVVAGGVGASSRFVVDGLVKSRLGDAFPSATMIINVSGSLLLGILTGLVLHQGASEDLRAVLGTGFCGGYTTFSTASFETVRLAQRGSSLTALTYAIATYALAAGAAAIGLVATV